MPQELCFSVVCDMSPRIVTAFLPDGTEVTFACCPLCGHTPPFLAEGHREKVAGQWLLPAHFVSEEESDRQLETEEVKAAVGFDHEAFQALNAAQRSLR